MSCLSISIVACFVIVNTGHKGVCCGFSKCIYTSALSSCKNLLPVFMRVSAYVILSDWFYELPEVLRKWKNNLHGTNKLSEHAFIGLALSPSDINALLILM